MEWDGASTVSIIVPSVLTFKTLTFTLLIFAVRFQSCFSRRTRPDRTRRCSRSPFELEMLRSVCFQETMVWFSMLSSGFNYAGLAVECEQRTDQSDSSLPFVWIQSKHKVLCHFSWTQSGKTSVPEILAAWFFHSWPKGQTSASVMGSFASKTWLFCSPRYNQQSSDMSFASMFSDEQTLGS